MLLLLKDTFYLGVLLSTWSNGPKSLQKELHPPLHPQIIPLLRRNLDQADHALSMRSNAMNCTMLSLIKSLGYLMLSSKLNICLQPVYVLYNEFSKQCEFANGGSFRGLF